MNRYSSVSRLLMWVMALVLAGFVSGCGEGDAGAGTGLGPTGGVCAGANCVSLGTAGNYVILTKTGIATTGVTAVTGNIGVSPAAASSITGFALSAPPTTFSTSPRVTGRVFAADYAVPTPATLTTAVSDMQAAYTDAAGRPEGVLNLGGGTLSGQTLVSGVYTWNSAVVIAGDITLSGGANEVWIFQISGILALATDKKVLLAGGAQARNIFWQVANAVALQAGSHFEGIILTQTNIAMATGATAKGRLLAQTEVALDQNTVTQP